MNKNLNDYPLLELLDVKSLLQTYPIEKRNEAIGEIFDAIAKKLFNE